MGKKKQGDEQEEVQEAAQPAEPAAEVAEAEPKTADPKAEAEAILAEARDLKAQAEAETAQMRSDAETARLAIEAALADISAREAAVAEAEAALAARAGEGMGDGNDLAGAPNCRELREGTVVYLNGRPVALAEDAFVRAHALHRDDQFAAMLAGDPDGNFERNAGSLSLLYSPLSGVLLGLAEQERTLEEMSDEEAALFAPPPARPAKK